MGSDLVFTPATMASLAREWPEELRHISASSLKMRARCPEQWRQRYVLGKKAPPGPALIQGIADHAAIETNYRHKMDTGSDLPVDDVLERFAASFDEELDKVGGPGGVDWGAEVKTAPQRKKAAGQLKDGGVPLVRLYREDVCPVWMPEAVEERFELVLPNLQVPVLGYIDLVAEPSELSLLEPGRRLIDRKTVGRAKSAPDPEYLLQARVYQLQRPLPFEWHLSVKGSKPKIVTFGERAVPSSEKTLAMIEMLVADIGFNYVRYGPDQPWPGAWSHPWACGYCGYAADCKVRL